MKSIALIGGAFALLVGLAAPALANQGGRSRLALRPAPDRDDQRRGGLVGARRRRRGRAGTTIPRRRRWRASWPRAARRSTDADGLLDEFAAKAGAEKSARLTRVFAGVLDLINSERDRVLVGIVRYAQGQNRLADKIRTEADKVSDAEESKERFVARGAGGGAIQPQMGQAHFRRSFACLVLCLRNAHLAGAPRFRDRAQDRAAPVI